MSFASIVSSVIDVPATHSWGVLRTCPAWTEAISSSADANSRPFACWIQRSFGCASAPGTSETTTIASTTIAPDRAVTVARGAAISASAIPTSALVSASSATTTGEPRSGMRTNGRTRLPTIAPVVFTPSRAPELVPARSAPSGSRADAAGNAIPRTTVTGRTTTITGPDQRGDGVERPARDEGVRVVEQPQERRECKRGDRQLCPGQEPQRVADPRPDQVEDDGAEGDPDQEHPEDHREHVGRVAGAGRQQAGPGDLVAQRRHARDERDQERQPGAVRDAHLGD